MGRIKMGIRKRVKRQDSSRVRLCSSAFSDAQCQGSSRALFKGNHPLFERLQGFGTGKWGIGESEELGSLF